MKITIINSKGHWINGWATTPASLNIIESILKKIEIHTSIVEIASLKELEKVLDNTSRDTLVWPNSYLVTTKKGEVQTLVNWIEKYKLPLIGSTFQTLMWLLQKDVCQTKLKEAQIPSPKHLIIKKTKFLDAKQILLGSSLLYPLVLKPTSESRSNGVVKVNNLEEAIHYIGEIAYRYPDSDILVEDFLPGDDVTCGFFEMGNKRMLLPSYCAIEGLDCKEGIYSEYHYTLPHTIESHPAVKDKLILEQLKEYVPKIVDLFKIRSQTRVDARMDAQRVLRYFDVNGMPGLNFPSSAVIKQVVTHFPNYPSEFLFECLIHTIIADGAMKYGFNLPSIIEENTLFTLESESILKLTKEENHEKTGK